MEKQKRDVSKLTDILDANGIKYTVTNIQEDPAAQYAVRRDSKGLRLPVVFVAGECVGGREQLVNAASSGELKKKVFGA
jgi:glutaredoxin-related protein